MLTTSFPRRKGDGQGQFIYQLARELTNFCEVTVICPFDHYKSNATSEEIDEIEIARFKYIWPARLQRLDCWGGLPVVIERNPFAIIQFPFYFIFFFLKSWKSAKKADVIHCQWLFSGIIGFLLHLILQKPYVVSIRGADQKMLNKVLIKYPSTITLRNAALITTVSEDLRRKVLDAGIDSKKVLTVENGLDVHFLKNKSKASARMELGVPNDTQMLLFVGSLIPRKRADILVDAVEILIKEDKRFLTYLIGDGPLKNELKKKISDKNLGNYIKLIGAVDYDKIPIWMSASDIFVLPTLSEGKPNVVLEAMGCGLPIISTNVAGIPEIVKNGRNGLLVEPENAEALSTAIKELLEDKNKRILYGNSGREHMLEFGLTWEQSAKKTYKLYRHVLEKGGSSWSF